MDSQLFSFKNNVFDWIDVGMGELIIPKGVKVKVAQCLRLDSVSLTLLLPHSFLTLLPFLTLSLCNIPLLILSLSSAPLHMAAPGHTSCRRWPWATPPSFCLLSHSSCLLNGSW